MPNYVRHLVGIVLIAYCWTGPAQVSAQTNAEVLFKEARSRETAIRRAIDARSPATPAPTLLARARTLTTAYEDMAKLFPKSDYADDSLWQGAMLAASMFWEFGDVRDREAALRLLDRLSATYPSSAFASRVPDETGRLASASKVGEPPPAGPSRPVSTSATLTAIRRETVTGALRLVIELDRETAFRDLQLGDPSRLVIDFQNARPSAELENLTQRFSTDVIRDVRVAVTPEGRTRVAVGIADAPPRTTYALYNPFRVVIDFSREPPPSRPAATARPPAHGPVSLSRQLGLGVATVVLDPGHGGHDSGALSDGVSEAELVLDIALRLERLLHSQPGVQVVLTRRSDVFVPLEERTAIANKAGADLFLSIHANASEDNRLRGVETYFLNFAPNPAAEAVASRENAVSARTMSQLPDIVKAIALNNKLDESRDFATKIHASMLEHLKGSNQGIKDLGVKQAPFVVLVGATMPSVLAEISFLTNKDEAALLRRPSYRQQIAEALLSGVMAYQRSLKTTAAAAAQP